MFPPSATWQRIRFAFAGCLQEAFGGQNTAIQEEEEEQRATSAGAGQDEEPDVRAVLIMEMLLTSLQSSNLNLTHMLMGFDVTKGVDGMSVAAGQHAVLIRSQSTVRSCLHSEQRFCARNQECCSISTVLVLSDQSNRLQSDIQSLSWRFKQCLQSMF